MPFTFAHPAAVLPFKWLPRRYYSWTALVTGAIVPDFEAFLKFGGQKQISHSWAGMFAFDLPVGLLLIYLFHALIKLPLVHNLPSPVARRIYPETERRPHAVFSRRSGVVVLSLLFGIFTHLVWDRITHTDTYTYHHKAGIIVAPHVETTIRQWMQWTNSFVGMLLIGLQIWRLPEYTFRQLPDKKFWFIIFCTAFVIVILRAQYPYTGDDLINTFLGGSFYGLLAASFLYRKKYQASQHE